MNVKSLNETNDEDELSLTKKYHSFTLLETKELKEHQDEDVDIID